MHRFNFLTKILLVCKSCFFISSQNASYRFCFYNLTGRIVNRFTKDTGSMDDQLPAVFFDPIYVIISYILLN